MAAPSPSEVCVTVSSFFRTRFTGRSASPSPLALSFETGVVVSPEAGVATPPWLLAKALSRALCLTGGVPLSLRFFEFPGAAGCSLEEAAGSVLDCALDALDGTGWAAGGIWLVCGRRSRDKHGAIFAFSGPGGA